MVLLSCTELSVLVVQSQRSQNKVICAFPSPLSLFCSPLSPLHPSFSPSDPHFYPLDPLFSSWSYFSLPDPSISVNNFWLVFLQVMAVIWEGVKGYSLGGNEFSKQCLPVKTCDWQFWQLRSVQDSSQSIVCSIYEEVKFLIVERNDITEPGQQVEILIIIQKPQSCQNNPACKNHSD